jgi:hypothetical protein
MPADTSRLNFTAEYAPYEGWLLIRYTLIDPRGQTVPEWSGSAHQPVSGIPERTASQLASLFGVIGNLLPVREVHLPEGTIVSGRRPSLYRILINSPGGVDSFLGPPPALSAGPSVGPSSMTPNGMRLLNDVRASLEAEAWKHLRQRLEVDPPTQSSVGVFVSYRARPDIEQFAEAVALRLQAEGLYPFFDKWDVMAGDSLTGQLQDAFAKSQSCILILSRDYRQGKWATQEMLTALTKRVTEGYRVIPALYEDCEIPDLLKDARWVDFRGHDENQFEVQIREVIQAVLGLTRRPYGPA